MSTDKNLDKNVDQNTDASAGPAAGNGDDKVKATAEYVYVGRRWNPLTKKLYYLWEGLTNAGDRITLTKGMSHGVGNVYRFSFANDARTEYWSKGKHEPKYLRRHEDTKEVGVWQSMDYEAYERQQEESAGSKPDPVLDRAMKPLLDLLDHARDKHGFIRVVQSKMFKHALKDKD